MRCWQHKSKDAIPYYSETRIMEKFKNKYRIESNRLKGWDYGSNALYFITICCKNRDCFFGIVNDGKMKLSAIGHIANSCFYEIPNHFPFVVLHNHVIMPNHIHGIIEIAKSNDVLVDDTLAVETQNIASLQPYKNKFGPQSKNLASIIRGYKTGVTTNARKINPDFAWQPNYHDHIIRNEKSYQNISNYIIENPLKWENDSFNTQNPNSDK